MKRFCVLNTDENNIKRFLILKTVNIVCPLPVVETIGYNRQFNSLTCDERFEFYKNDNVIIWIHVI